MERSIRSLHHQRTGLPASVRANRNQFMSRRSMRTPPSERFRSLRHRWTARTIARRSLRRAPRFPAVLAAGSGSPVRPKPASKCWSRREGGTRKTKKPSGAAAREGFDPVEVLSRLGEMSPMSRARARERRTAALRSDVAYPQGQHCLALDFVATNVSARAGLLRALFAQVNLESASAMQQRKKISLASHSPRSAMSSRWIISARPA
jgi:hypothetical protein